MLRCLLFIIHDNKIVSTESTTIQLTESSVNILNTFSTRLKREERILLGSATKISNAPLSKLFLVDTR